MNAVLLYDLNHAALWRRSIRVWDRQVRAASLDRLLFLTLHRAGWMGSEEAELLKRWMRPGMRVLDVGANIGLYSLLLSGLVGEEGRVYSFEPEPQLCATLRQNCAANGLRNVVAFECAAGSDRARATFQRSAFNSGNNSLGRGASAGATVEVEVFRIDDLVPEERIDFVKIDVQGYELHALLGMERLLAASPNAAVLFEFWPGGLQKADTSPDELLRFFADRDFAVYEGRGGKLRPLVDAAGLIQRLGPRGYTNLMASRRSLSSDE